jgi:indole-3-glycerol phosphate synthase
LLRKDFIVDPYQVYESRAYGADALLLIVAVLTPPELQSLLALSRSLGLGCLVEVHDEAQLEVALQSGAEIIGINNRDLTTFKVDMSVTERLRPLVPSDRLVVSESGIKTRHDMEKLLAWGVNAALVGESLMAAPDIAAAVKGLIS